MYSYFVQCLREIKSMTNHDVGSPLPERRLLDLLRDAIRRKHYSYRTEQSYVHWARRFIFFHGKRHPRELGGDEVAAFLTHLARERSVAASTQNQALAALLFLYGEVLGAKLPWMQGIERAKRPVRVPVVLTREEVRALLAQLEGTKWLMAGFVFRARGGVGGGPGVGGRDGGVGSRAIAVGAGRG